MKRCNCPGSYHYEHCPIYKYEDLLGTVKEQLRILEPWYKEGAVVDPMNAVRALGNIDRAVRE